MNTPDRYPVSMRVLHWAMVALVVAQLGVGMAMSGPDDVIIEGLFGWHMSLGVLVLLTAAVRLANRLRARVPGYPATLPAWERSAARAAHVALYALMLAVPVLGYLAAGADPDGHGVRAFGLTLPTLVEPSAARAQALGEWHESAVWTFTGLLLLHVGAVVKHAFFDRRENDVLPRML